MLIPPFTVTENIMLGGEKTELLGILDRAGAAERISQLSESYGLQVDPRARVEDLTVVKFHPLAEGYFQGTLVAPLPAGC